MAAGSHFYGAPQFGQTQWTAPGGPIGHPAGPGLPGTALQPARRTHSLGPIPAVPVVAPADDAAAWALLRELDTKRQTGDMALRKLGVHPPMTMPAADQTIAGRVAGGDNRVKALEQAGYAERYRGDLTAFRTLSDNVSLMLHAGETITLPTGAVQVGQPPMALIAQFLEAARLGQLPRAATTYPAFRQALKDAYTLAHLTQHVRLGQGQAVRWVEHTGRTRDWAWLYFDESNPLAPAGYHNGYQVHYAPGPNLTEDVLAHTRSLNSALASMQAELIANVATETPVPSAYLPGVGAKRAATFLLAAAAAGLIYVRYGRGRRWPKLGRRKKARGANGRARTLQLT